MDKFPLARAVWPHLAGWGILALVATWVGYPVLYIPLWLVVAFIAYFFRDPARAAHAPASAILSPADGKVVVIEEVSHPWLPEKVKLVSIFMNVFNVHVNRAPIGGEVEKVEHAPGAFLRADLDQARTANEQAMLQIKGENGLPLVVSQVAGLVARKIICDLKPGRRISRGERYGMICFGSRLDLYMPLETEVSVKLGDKVKAGLTQIGEW